MECYLWYSLLRICIILGITSLEEAESKIGDPKSAEPQPLADATNAPKAQPNGQNAPAPNGHSAYSAPQGNGAPAKQYQPANIGPIYPIEGLSPYQNKWTIKARVTSKSDIKHWTNAKGEGKLFSVNLMDETSEIKATGFNEQCDDFYNRLEEGKVYYISKARVSLAKKQFSNLSNEYEIMFERSTEIEPCHDATNVPQVKFNFVDIQKLNEVEKDSLIDMIGVISNVGEVGQITTKAGKPYSKRDLDIVDQSLHTVRLTLWGKQAETFDGSDRPVIAFKGVKVSDFGGRSLSMFSSSSMTVNPDIPEAHRLRGWYDSQGAQENFTSFSSSGATFSGRDEDAKTLKEVKDSQLGMSEKPDYFNVKATVGHIRQENLSYPACPSKDCNKKVFMDGNGWRCEKCDTVYPAPEHRYIMSFNVWDHTEQVWLNGFNDIGQQLLGRPAGDMYDLKENDENAFGAAIQEGTCTQWLFRCKAKQESFQDTLRVRYTVMTAAPLDYKKESKKLVEIIAQYGQ